MTARLKGFGALLLLVVIVVGVPLALVATGANPIPASVTSWQSAGRLLTSADDGTLVLALIKVAAWVSWAVVTLSVLLEAAARVRGLRAPRLPGLRLSQVLARSLVSAVVVLFATAPMAHATEPTRDLTSVVATITDTSTTPAAAAAPAPAAQAPVSAPPDTVPHTVAPGETLWSIAQQYLGSGERYTEIAALSSDVLGGKPGFLRPGWVLTLPAPAGGDIQAPASVVVEAGDTLSGLAQEHLGDPDRYPEILQASRDIAQPGGAHLSDPDVIDVGWTVNLPTAQGATEQAAAEQAAAEAEQAAAEQAAAETERAAAEQAGAEEEAAERAAAERAAAERAAAEQVAAAEEASAEAAAAEAVAAGGEAALGSTSTAPDTDTAAAADVDEDSPWAVRTAGGVGALLAAGLLTLVATRRRAQQRRRRPGQQLPMPQGRTAEVEHELRATADVLSVEAVDAALRVLAHRCAKTGAPLPTVRAARLTADQFDLYLAEPATLPDPWTGTADATVWTLNLEHGAEPERVDVDDVTAPYPALVTIGHDQEDGHVLVDLEYLGALGITGGDTDVREILAALAIELATSVWADDMQVTVVGAFAELEDALQTGRIRYLPSVGRVLDELTERARQDRSAMEHGQVPDLQHARVQGVAPDAWAPQIVLLAGEVTDRQRVQLEQLLQELPRVAIAAITTGLSVGEWGLDLTAGDDAGSAVLAPLGLQLRPQRVPAEQYAHILHAVAMSDPEDLPEHDAADADAAISPIRSTITPIVVDLPSEPITQTPTASASPSDITTGSYLPSRHGGADTEAPTHDPHQVASGVLDDDDAMHEQDAGQTTDVVDDAPSTVGGEARRDVDEEAGAQGPAAANVEQLVPPAPRIVVLGPVDVLHARGTVEPNKRNKLREYAAFLVLHPRATAQACDDAIWPIRRSEDNLNTRNTATSKLRKWVGVSVDGREYLPRHNAADGYGFISDVRSDVDDWNDLLTDGPLNSPTGNLEQALRLVRGRPFEGHHPRQYAWAEPLTQRLISEIVDASYELGRRRLMEGRWRAAEEALVVGLRSEPAQERLWRLRILTAHEARDTAGEIEAIQRLLAITEELQCDLEPETATLLEALKNPRAQFDQLMAQAL